MSSAHLRRDHGSLASGRGPGNAGASADGMDTHTCCSARHRRRSSPALCRLQRPSSASHPVSRPGCRGKSFPVPKTTLRILKIRAYPLLGMRGHLLHPRMLFRHQPPWGILNENDRTCVDRRCLSSSTVANGQSCIGNRSARCPDARRQPGPGALPGVDRDYPGRTARPVDPVSQDLIRRRSADAAISHPPGSVHGVSPDRNRSTGGRDPRGSSSNGR